MENITNISEENISIYLDFNQDNFSSLNHFDDLSFGSNISPYEDDLTPMENSKINPKIANTLSDLKASELIEEYQFETVTSETRVEPSENKNKKESNRPSASKKWPGIISCGFANFMLKSKKCDNIKAQLEDMRRKVDNKSYTFEKLKNLKQFLKKNPDISEMLYKFMEEDFDSWVENMFKGNSKSIDWLKKNKKKMQRKIFLDSSIRK